jgi:hypothetical protein
MMLLLSLQAVPGGWAQTAPDMSHFEVASVRLDTRDFRSLGDDAGKCKGGPGTESPTLWVCYLVNPGLLIYQGFRPEVYQFITPGWMDSIHLAISARVPAARRKISSGRCSAIC